MIKCESPFQIIIFLLIICDNSISVPNGSSHVTRPLNDCSSKREVGNLWAVIQTDISASVMDYLS